MTIVWKSYLVKQYSRHAFNLHAKNHLHTVIERFLCDCFKCSSESVELVDARQSCPQFSKNWVASLDCCLLFTVAFKGFLLVILTAKDWWISPINHLCKVQWLQQHDHPMIKSCDGSHGWWIVHLILFHIQLKWSKNLMKQSWSSAKRKWCIICDECLIGAILIYRQTQEALGQFSDIKCTRNSIHSTSKAQKNAYIATQLFLSKVHVHPHTNLSPFLSLRPPILLADRPSHKIQ